MCLLHHFVKSGKGRGEEKVNWTFRKGWGLIAARLEDGRLEKPDVSKSRTFRKAGRFEKPDVSKSRTFRKAGRFEKPDVSKSRTFRKAGCTTTIKHVVEIIDAPLLLSTWWR